MLVSLGVTHKRAALATLDAVTFRDTERFYLLTRALPEIRGSMLLQTCNRVEVYLDADEPDKTIEKILSHWALETRFKLHELSRLVEARREDEVIEHLVRLCTGLESMLVGETQILGQIKSALSQSQSKGGINQLLSDLVDRCIASGAKIREQTGISKGAVSLGSAALQLAEASLGSVDHWRVLVVGTGQAAMLSMKALRAREIETILVSGRTTEGTKSFCRKYGGDPVGFEHAREMFSSLDLIIVATSATKFLITRDMTPPRAGRNLVILDLSSPRNVSPEVQDVPGVVLKTVDDLRGIADESLRSRRDLVKKAEPLVRERSASISGLVRRETAEPIVSEIFKRANSIRARELEKTLAKMKLTLEEERALNDMTRSIVEKLLALPVIHLRRAAEKGDNELLLAGGQIFRGE